MPKRKYLDLAFSPDRRAIVDAAVGLVDDYQARGYSLTLRQIYYAFVSRDLFPAAWADPATGSTNNERSYKKLGGVIGDARMAGLIDWLAIEDRTREVDGNAHWDSPAAMVNACADQFALDKWNTQDHRVEVWVEKDALEGVLGKVANDLDVPFFSCRGYGSDTSFWNAGQRFKGYAEAGQTPVLIHLGDHDPSGIDMSRDIAARVGLFMDGLGGDLVFERVALNLGQVRRFDPPPNPAKVTDSRFRGYVEAHGTECWELDALDPEVIEDVVRSAVLPYRDEDRFADRLAAEADFRRTLRRAADHWHTKVAVALAGEPGEDPR